MYGKKRLPILCLAILLSIAVSCQKGAKKNNTGAGDTTTTTTGINKGAKPPSYMTSFVPGKRLANIVLGRNAQPLMDSLGTPDYGDAAMGKSVSAWEISGENNAILSLYKSIKMGVEDFPRVQSIRTTSAKFRSEDGLTVGSSVKEIQEIYDIQKVGTFPENGSRYTLFDTNAGVGFEIGPDNKCHGILIHRPGQKTDENYLSFYKNFERTK